MPRYFTVSQAEASIPDVERSLRRILELKTEFNAAEAVFQAYRLRIAQSGGSLVNLNRFHALRDRRAEIARDLKGVADGVSEAGVLIKDIDTGLVDFPSLYQGREVYLCWRLGERSIEYWHEVDAGFAGRRRIDGEFRAHHSGGGGGEGGSQGE